MMLPDTPRDICKATCPATFTLFTDHVARFCAEREFPLVVAEIFAEDWVAGWAGFTEACEFVVARDWLGNEDVHLADAEYLEKLRDWISMLCMLVLQNKNVEVRTDAARLQELAEEEGLYAAEASGHDCNCLVESLITVFQKKGFFKVLTFVHSGGMLVKRIGAHLSTMKTLHCIQWSVVIME